jgi:uncharacterized membrane protein
MTISYGPEHAAIRIGHSERESAARALGEHFAAGRLDQHEFDERVTATYAARTYADLGVLFTDLPEPRPTRPRAAEPTRPPVPAAGPGRDGGWPVALRRGRWLLTTLPWPVAVVLVVVMLALMVGAVLALVPFLWVPLIWLWFCLGPRSWHRGHGRRWR